MRELDPTVEADLIVNEGFTAQVNELAHLAKENTKLTGIVHTAFSRFLHYCRALRLWIHTGRLWHFYDEPHSWALTVRLWAVARRCYLSDVLFDPCGQPDSLLVSKEIFHGGLMILGVARLLQLERLFSRLLQSLLTFAQLAR